MLKTMYSDWKMRLVLFNNKYIIPLDELKQKIEQIKEKKLAKEQTLDAVMMIPN